MINVEDDEIKITGIHIYYYTVCKRKLWFFHHNIQLEEENEDVKIGKVIDESTYLRDNKHINIDNVINIDFIRSSKIIHEVKKSRSIEEASILQVKYYLFYLHEKGVNGVKGKIDYPLLKQTINVELTEDDIKQITEIVKNIKEIVLLKSPPCFKKQKICKKCAYYELCFI